MTLMSTKSLPLPLWGQAHLELDGKTIALRQKSLVVLYYLALEGPTSRETFAELLWDRSDAISNLRVELHDLRHKLAKFGIDAFPKGQDPLELPCNININTNPGQGAPLGALERGLETLSSGFEHWLEARRRNLLEPSQSLWDRSGLAAKLTQTMRTPSVLILHGLPGSDRASFASSLAKSMGLPFIEGLNGPSKSLKFIKPPYPKGVLETILENKDGVFVLARSTFGEVPRLLLELEEELPESRIFEFRLPPLSWLEARQGPLLAESFSSAARHYLFSQGNPAHLRELLQTRNETTLNQPPFFNNSSRMQSKIQLEARYLSLEARLSLEKLCIQPGVIPDGLIEVFEAEPFVEELERRGWLRFTDGWYFAFESVRRVMYQTVKAGFRFRMHQRALAYFAGQNEEIQEAYHRLGAFETVDWRSLLTSAESMQRLTLSFWLKNELHRMPGELEDQSPLDLTPQSQERHVDLEQELALLESHRFGNGLEHENGQVRLVRSNMQLEVAGLSFAPNEEPSLLHLRGRVFIEHLFGMGLSNQAIPLEIGLIGSRPKIIFLPVQQAITLNGTDILPLTEELDHWFYLPQGVGLSITSKLENGILELELSSYAVAEAGTIDTKTVEAFDLSNLGQKVKLKPLHSH
jgi:hypothetical protein